MNAWARRWALAAGALGASLALLAGIALGVSVPALVLRAAVVGVVLFAAVRILARLAGETVLRVALASRLGEANETVERDTAEARPGGRRAAA